MIRLLVFLLTLLHAGAALAASGFQWADVPVSGGEPLKVAIWYPTAAQPAYRQIGPFEMNVAVDAPVQGTHHALIVMSHGTGGSALNSYDTAMALAEAGFIVAAVQHTGDNYLDHSVSFTARNFVLRPQQISRVIDYMLTGWPAHAAVDPTRIGLFGHSAGGATGLLAGGGIGDWQRVGEACASQPGDWGCSRARAAGVTGAPQAAPRIAGWDPRVRALVLAAPAVAVMFQPGGLAGVTIPVQLWIGERDDIVPDARLVPELLPKAPDYHLVRNGGHFAFLAPCNEILRSAALEICTDPKDFDREAFLHEFQRDVVTFFKRTLA
ncbi:MAG: dienelactone hydrolase [Proteobacteria bacterium]|nr:dienelactone hydrolase [Pseudomonadota bacterium]